MTVGVVIRVPGAGAVLACDGRVTGSSGDIYTDTDQKWGEFGTAIAVCAGTIGGLWLELHDSPPRNVTDLRKRVTDRSADYMFLAYDRSKDRVVHLDESGDLTVMGAHAAIGCGGAIALGVLDASKPPNTLEAAAKLAGRAVKIACKRNALCGGRIRTVIVRGRKGAVEVR